MTISVKVVADSISHDGKRITTMQLMYPRFIHSEFMTHRVFTRNASSSRAIPVAKMIQAVLENPAMPVFWGKNQAGMQAREALVGEELGKAQDIWLNARDEAVKHVEGLMAVGLHKQLANRLLEPWQHIHVVVTATEWQNFFDLRCHPDAQPEIQALAVMMRDAMLESSPRLLANNQWHLPYVLDSEIKRFAGVDPTTLIKVSAARCARVSYLKHDGNVSSIDEDVALFDRLVGSRPLHASPIEHQAQPDFIDAEECWAHPHLHGNFVGWRQFRKTYEQFL